MTKALQKLLFILFQVFVSDETVVVNNVYTYDSNLNLEITSIEPPSITVAGGVVVRIYGNGFNKSDANPVVNIGDKLCEYVSHNETTVACIAPDNAAGMFPVSVHVRGIGTTRNEVNSSLTYILLIFDLKPNCGSFLGGTLVTITGEGFGENGTLLDVTMGGHRCNVKTCSDKVLTCVTSPVAKTVNLDNSGSHHGKDFCSNYFLSSRIK